MPLDRSKFKPTTISSLKAKDKELYSAVYDNDDNSGRIPRLKISAESTTYKLRLYPGHPDHDGSLSIEPILVNYIPGMKPKYVDGKVQKDDNGNVILEKVTNKKVFNAKVHGGAKKDLIETYIRLAESDAKERFENEDKRAAFLIPIKGNSYQGGKESGILPKPTWVGYADLIEEGDKKTFYEIEIGKAIKNQMNKIAAIEASDDPLGTDSCFTDIEEAQAIKVIVAKKGTAPQDYYTVALDNTKVPTTIGGKVYQLPKKYPLSDEDLEKLLAAPPLINYRKVFTNRDLQLQLQGLKMFEQDHPEYKYLETDEFLETYSYLDEFFPVQNEQSNTPSSDPDETPEPDGDKFDTMSKDELKKWNKDNRTGITILPSMNEDMIREMLRQWESGAPDAEEVEVEEEVMAEAEEAPSQPKLSTEDRIRKLREKTGKA